MTRFVVDCDAVLELLADGTRIASQHQLVAPALLKSQVLSRLHEMVQRGELPPRDARARLERFDTLRVRYLSDRVSRSVAWQLADQLGWASTYRAEYMALTRLQGDALIALDPELAAAAASVVAVASIDDLA